MKSVEITKADRVLLKELLSSEAWVVVMKLYDDYRIDIVAELVDGPDVLPEGMTTLAFKAKYRAHGATEMLNMIEAFANSKDLEKKKPPIVPAG